MHSNWCVGRCCFAFLCHDRTHHSASLFSPTVGARLRRSDRALDAMDSELEYCSLIADRQCGCSECTLAAALGDAAVERRVSFLLAVSEHYGRRYLSLPLMEMDELGTPVSLVIPDLARQAARGPSEGVDSAVSEQEPQAVYATQVIRASRARGPLVIQWRAACRPRGQGAIPAVPPCDCASFPPSPNSGFMRAPLPTRCATSARSLDGRCTASLGCQWSRPTRMGRNGEGRATAFSGTPLGSSLKQGSS